MTSSASDPIPRAGEVWYAYLDPILGHEQGVNRPVVVVPLTATDKPYGTHILVRASEANLRTDSWAMCEQIRAVSFERFSNLRGKLSEETLATIRTVVAKILRD